MDLMTRAYRGIRGAATARAPEQRMFGGTFGDSSIMPNSVMMGQGSSGLVLTEAGVLSISTAISCVRVLFEDFLLMPFGAYTGNKFGAHQPIPEQPLVVTQPWGPDLPAVVGFAQAVASIKLRGAAYFRVLDEDKYGNPTLMNPLHPDACWPWIDPRNGQKKYRVRNLNGTQEELGTGEVKQVNSVHMPGSIKGLDPISYQRVMLGEAADLQQYGANYFRNGSNQSGVISVPGAGNRRKAREIKDMWEASHSGVYNAHRPGVLFGGATWQPMSITNENAQWLGTRQFMREEICGWFGVPLQRIHAMNEKMSSGGAKGLSTITTDYAQFTLGSMCTIFETLFDQFIPGGERTWTMFNMRALLRADPETRARIGQMHRLTAVRNSNEIRAEDGWEPYPGGEDYQQPFNTAASMNSSTGTGGDGGSGSPDGEH